MRYIIGIDEAGRGPIAGPVCVGACLVYCRARRSFLRGVRESKQLSEEKRVQWDARLRGAAAEGKCQLRSVFVGERSIDRDGLGTAIKRAVRRVLFRFAVAPESCRVLLDGALRAPRTYPFQETIIGGDEHEPLIAAASVIAKVRRDQYMARLARRYPQYGFEKHKGYGTRAHYAALREYGLLPVHRRSFLKNFVKTVSH